MAWEKYCAKYCLKRTPGKYGQVHSGSCDTTEILLKTALNTILNQPNNHLFPKPRSGFTSFHHIANLKTGKSTSFEDNNLNVISNGGIYQGKRKQENPSYQLYFFSLTVFSSFNYQDT